MSGHATFATTAVGYRQLPAPGPAASVSWHAPGVEGTASYGAALTRYLRRNGLTVIEVNRPDRAARRHGKTDTIDAVAAARAARSPRATTVAKTADRPIEMLRLFHLAIASAVKAHTQAINQLTSSSPPTRSCAKP